MADEKVLPTIELPCDRFPCTEKNRPEPLKHRWVPLMHREMVVNHYTESRNMNLSDLRAVLECLTPMQIREVWPYATEACPVRQIADLRERATAAEAAEPAAEVADALCADCNQVYGVRDGYEDTGICDPCAQSRVVGEQPADRAGPDVGTVDELVYRVSTLPAAQRYRAISNIIEKALMDYIDHEVKVALAAKEPR